MKTFPRTVLTLLAILLATPALSQPQTPGPLKPQQVKGFLDALAELEAWGEQNDRIVERVEIPGDANDLTPPTRL